MLQQGNYNKILINTCTSQNISKLQSSSLKKYKIQWKRQTENHEFFFIPIKLIGKCHKYNLINKKINKK